MSSTRTDASAPSRDHADHDPMSPVAGVSAVAAKAKVTTGPARLRRRAPALRPAKSSAAVREQQRPLAEHEPLGDERIPHGEGHRRELRRQGTTPQQPVRRRAPARNSAANSTMPSAPPPPGCTAPSRATTASDGTARGSAELETPQLAALEIEMWDPDHVVRQHVARARTAARRPRAASRRPTAARSHDADDRDATQLALSSWRWPATAIVPW